MNITGWLFDVYPTSNGVTIWFIDEDGIKYKVHYPFRAVFYLDLHKDESAILSSVARKYRIAVPSEKVEKIELYSNTILQVTEVQVRNPLEYQKVIHELSKYLKFYQFYNADIKPAQMFYYITGLFPLAFGRYTVIDDVLVSWELSDTFDAEIYSLPQLNFMSVTPSMTLLAPKYQRTLSLEIEVDGRTTILEQNSPEELLQGINSYLDRYDPDIILTSYGDAALLPLLTSLASRYKIPFHLNRDTTVPYVVTTAMSYFTYGQIKHREGAFELAGRWHLDKENSFIINESDLDGLYDIARLSQTNVQRQARTSIGSALASMQLSWAYRHNVLVPYKRPVKEEFKTLSTLLVADRGGLHFMPKLGYHEQIAELDFASMYPTLMKNHNISPETLNCTCCRQTKNTVPEIGFRICEKRIGLVAETLSPILSKRAKYKQLKKHAPTEELKAKYDKMQSALKWILVTCFGYLGFKKSRMGRIEAHETVNAFARDGLLQAKEIAENNGFELIHAIVDCVWLKKKGATEKDYIALCSAIEHAVGVNISLEGIYNWILFPSSKMDSDIPTATRYVGVYTNGERKIRGIEVRRRDTPKFIRKVQEDVLDVLSQATTLAELYKYLPASLDAIRYHITELRSGKVDPLQLVIKRHISKEPQEYENRSINAIVAQTLEEAGVHLSPGESIHYIIIDASGKKNPAKAKPLALYSLEDGYDIEKYTELTLKAIETLLEPLGYSMEVLRKELGLVPLKKRILQKRKDSALSETAQCAQLEIFQGV